MSHVSFCPPPYIILPEISFCPLSFCPMEIFKCTLLSHLHYLIYPCPVSFCHSVSFCPLYHFAPPPWKSFNDLCYLPMSRIILPPGFILPPYHFAPWKSFNVHYFPIPVSFCLLSFCPHIILPPIILPPWKLFHDLHYLPISSIILPHGLILPHIILPPIILPP